MYKTKTPRPGWQAGYRGKNKKFFRRNHFSRKRRYWAQNQQNILEAQRGLALAGALLMAGRVDLVERYAKEPPK